MPNGSFDDDSEPLVIKTHAPLQIENVDMRINILKAYLVKSPGATIKDLKKSLVGFSKYTEDEFKELVKSASSEKYNELYPTKLSDFGIPSNKKVAGVKKGTTIERLTKDEIEFLEAHRSYTRQNAYKEYQKEFPESPRKLQFLYDYYHQNPTSAKAIPRAIKHVTQPMSSPMSNHHVLAQAINSLYKSGKSPKLFSQIKPVIELIKDPNEVDFAIECLTS